MSSITPPTSSPASSSGPAKTSASSRSVTPEQPRKKKWAPKSRTGCLTCRARRIKCDEAKPACKKCVSGGRTCQGYEDPFVTSHQHPAKVQGKAGIRLQSSNAPQVWPIASSRRASSKVVEPFRTQTLEPFECDFAQCAKYYFEVVHPIAFYKLDTDKRVRMAVANIKNINRPRFIIHATAEYLNRVSRAQNALPNPSALPASRKEWNKFHRYALEVLQDVNQNIEQHNPTPESMAAVLVRIFSLINSELYTLGPSWRAHIIGFLAFIKMKWNLGSILKTGLTIPSTTWVITNAVLVNTTSPPNNQIMPVYDFSLDEIRQVFSRQFYSELPCPSVLFLCIHRISQLRMRLANGEPAAALRPLARAILDEVELFDANSWTEPWGVPDDKPALRVLARAYRAAVRLYGIMTLPLPTTSAHGKETARDELMAHVRAAMPLLDAKLALHWCLPVAGVALADGPLEDRALVEYVLMGWKQDMEFYLPFHVRDTLRRFWASGSTAWDDCWTEPFPPLC
ncbi:Zn(2)-C6 fungal-type DNA-binding domain protein [Cordyceps fumosorosea ARSEF 2679]|uniref:Zn(2)-C6 fungal-type DNA-binding domain protein n=1 Tax=Cordyceps fumosorosea (strain ARSEF 2679) TaxID=1081104 RepID=A0A162LH86_CORFA|nr:Zn(2)-C6 fungal-type DNA-binding domain protein [Cordyceps fumosorosea ARSEF 2679]OAA70554.1 Zn(2)-C6 fungal-type DNA-binding domain protein [Cordyceps fumosorosea ARSEF 2679]